MDSLDLFKKLTTNLAFVKKKVTNGSILKRKLEENGTNDPAAKRQMAEQTEEPAAKAPESKSHVNKKGKKKDLLKINEEEVAHSFI
jgi:hypothetical protein